MMGARIEAFEVEIKAIKGENDYCLKQALETLVEARKVVKDAFKDKILVPLAKDWFLIMDTSKDVEEGLKVEFRD